MFDRDFFISYTQMDRAWAEWIAWVLEEDGHHVLIQAWDFVAGSSWVQGMRAGISRAERTIAVLSPDYLASKYGTAEWEAAWADDPLGAKRKLLTVRVKECDQPDLLGLVVSADVFGISEVDARTRLRMMISSALTGRAKPVEAPAFPGGERAVPHEPRFPGMLPQIWRVPPRNPHFTGRSDDLAALAAALADGATVSVHAVRGMGGVGKTQLATEYAHAHATDYDLVYWIAAEEPAALPDQFAALAGALGMNPVPDPESLQAQVHDRLRTIPGWLLIFDNASRADDLRPWLPSGPLPSGIPGHVILTTRRGGFVALGQEMHLDVISRADALVLLRAWVPSLAEETGLELAEELGCLPLALEQAGAYLNRTTIPAQDYLRLLRQRPPDVYLRGQVSGRTDTIATLWVISLKRVASENLAAAQLLDLCAYLAPERIPLDLFTLHPEQLPEPLAATAADELAFDDAIGVLVDYSLVKRTETGLQIHRLLQHAIRARRTANAEAGNAVKATRGAAGDENWSLIVLRLLRADAPVAIMGAPEGWPRWAVLLPHVLAATDHPGDTLRPGDAAGLDAAWLLDRAAVYLQVLGQPERARPLAERALTIDETTYGPDHSRVAIDLNNLAQILRDLGQPERARPLAERALTIDEIALGPDHPSVATDLNNLALILWDLGQPLEARLLAERALAIDETTYGLQHPSVATDLSNLAQILHGLGQREQAWSLAERALAIDETAYGPHHPIVAALRSSLARVLGSLEG